jgi:hypothetical protein
MNHLLTSPRVKVYKPVSKIEHLEKLFPEGNGTVWLKQEFELPQNPPGLQAVLLGAINPVNRCYINGILIGESGTLPESGRHYFSDWNKVRYYTFPAEILRLGKNQLLVEISVRHEGAYDGLVRIGPAARLGREATFAGVIRNHLYSLIAAVLFFIGFFYIFIFIRRPGDRDCLYYGLMCFFSVIALTNFFATDLPFDISKYVNYLVFQKIVFCALLLVTYFFVRFNMLYFRPEAGRVPRRFFALLIAAGCIIFIMMPDARYMIKARQYVFMATILPQRSMSGYSGHCALQQAAKQSAFFSRCAAVFFCTMFDIIWIYFAELQLYLRGFLVYPPISFQSELYWPIILSAIATDRTDQSAS